MCYNNNMNKREHNRARRQLIQEGWRVRQIAGVKVLQGPPGNEDLISPYHTVYWGIEDAIAVRERLGHWDRHYGLGDQITCLSYHSLLPA
jgi:hypothetical protein